MLHDFRESVTQIRRAMASLKSCRRWEVENEARLVLRAIQQAKALSDSGRTTHLWRAERARFHLACRDALALVEARAQ